MENLVTRINQALATEEVRAEKIASNARLTLLVILSVIALLNAGTLTLAANAMNFGALVVGYIYGFVVSIQVHRQRYRPVVKYITSCIDVLLVMLLLVLYTSIETPSVALKHYVFLVVFPLIGLTALRYDVRLTLLAGIAAVGSYVGMLLYFGLTGKVTIVWMGYAVELFTDKVTMVGQATKLLILAVYVALIAYLAGYSRRLMQRLVRQEIEVQSEKESFERELEVAGLVQSQLLPHEFPHVGSLQAYGKVEPGRFVGGDYCDFIRLSDDRLLVIVADVSGKGVPAALIMSEVRASVHLLASAGDALGDMAERLNDLLQKSTERKTFVTFFAGEIDSSALALRYINAGHPPPLIIRDGQVVPLLRGTIPLGVKIPLPHCEVHSEHFSRGNVLVCYTDGILECRNTLGEEYGEERLREFLRNQKDLRAQELVQDLLKDVKDHAQGRELDDDITAAVVLWLND